MTEYYINYITEDATKASVPTRKMVLLVSGYIAVSAERYWRFLAAKRAAKAKPEADDGA